VSYYILKKSRAGVPPVVTNPFLTAVIGEVDPVAEVIGETDPADAVVGERKVVVEVEGSQEPCPVFGEVLPVSNAVASTTTTNVDGSSEPSDDVIGESDPTTDVEGSL